MIKHLACIMDGNRRWARKQGWQIFKGHEQGAKTVDCVVKFCLNNTIPYLSLYAFSTENFNRSEIEKTYLFGLIVKKAQEVVGKFVENNVRVRFIGDRSLFPKSTRPAINKLEQVTKDCTALTVCILFCYSARQELVSSVKNIAHKVACGQISEDSISEETVKEHLWTNGLPEPELIIRTGGRKRLSNFLLYQAAYSEFCFLDCLWPELTTEHLQTALTTFIAEQRNFGT